MTQVIVTIVMPCFNAAATVEASIRSVQAQTRGNWQLTAVDDGSQDGTAEVIEAIGDVRIRLIRQVNAGVSAARNRALREVRTPYVTFLDADDTWAPGFLELMLGALSANADAALAYCGWEDVHSLPRRRLAHDPPDYEAAGPQKFAQLLRRCPWVIHAAVSRTEAVREAGGFDPHFAIAEDFLLWLRIAARWRIVRVPGRMAFYHHDSVRLQATRNVVRVVRATREVLTKFLDEHPNIAREVGRSVQRDVLYRHSLRSGYDALWARDLATAQALFRDCVRVGYLGRRDLKYLLPALLPGPIFRSLVMGRDAGASARPG